MIHTNGTPSPPAVARRVAKRRRGQKEGFASALLDWFDVHGRHYLPWQACQTPYRVWVSEIMLQQTQVATVIPYYERFLARFPDIESLARASLDEVLHLWTGLGYYARARNMHRAAKIVVEAHGARLPEDITALEALPGIGRSTAGAILALSRGQRHPILDGNARRVLARHFGVEGHTAAPQTLRCLWELARACTPYERVDAYTQAIMDLGATVCTRAHPACSVCPVRATCIAHTTGRQAELPAPRRARPRPRRDAVAMVVVRDGGAILLQQRSGEGLWGGLWTWPQFESEDEAFAWLARNAGSPVSTRRLNRYDHAFTHFNLCLQPFVAIVAGSPVTPEGCIWYDPAKPARIGLTRPVTALLSQL